MRKATVKTVSGDQFGTEVTPVAFAVINDIGGLMSKTTAKAKKLYKKNSDVWDGSSNVLSHPTHNKIYCKSGGELTDVAAQQLYDAGLLREPDVDTLWRALASESKTTRTILRAGRSIVPRPVKRRPGSEWALFRRLFAR